MRNGLENLEASGTVYISEEIARVLIAAERTEIRKPDCFVDDYFKEAGKERRKEQIVSILEKWSNKK